MQADDRRPGTINYVAPFAGGMISGWPSGIDNRSSDQDVPRSSLRDAVNCDILTSGKPRRRRGMRQVIADAGAHSVYGSPSWLVWATATTLNISGPNLVKRVLLTDIRLAAPISYTVLNNEIYFSNEAINGKITAAGNYEPWGITPPSVPPLLSAVTGNRFIQVTCVFITASGEESGAPIGRVVSCGDNPVITVTGIPQSSDSRVVATRLYATDVDGREFFQAADVAAGNASYIFNGTPYKGQPLRTQFMQPPPPGQLISDKNGLIYIASGSNVFHTEPLNYNLYDPDAAFFMYSERVTLCRATNDGLYVSADQTYFLPKAGTDDVTQWPALPYKAYEGAACESIHSNDVFWMSERGFVVGTQSGEMTNLTEKQLAIDSHERGCMGIIETDGHKALVAIMKETKRVSPLASSDYILARGV